MEDLPTDYDAVVVGTGMSESIVAAALSRIGKSVLHLDRNDFYGENWASFNLDNLEQWITSVKNDNAQNDSLGDVGRFIGENETLVRCTRTSNISNVQDGWLCPEEKSEEESVEKEPDVVEKNNSSTEWTIKKIKNEFRRFNLDLCPKMLFSKGSLVELLISSNIARYAEFKSVNRVLTWRNNRLEPVPCSRADVFATKNVSVVEKRMLVKILTSFAEYPKNAEEFQGFEKKTFFDYLKHKKLPENLIHYILYAIAMGTNSTPCIEGVKASKAFLESLGRYGNTPFIFPIYGSGELPQCFCRLCAVFGGVYHLKRGVDGLIIKDKKCCGVVSGNQRLNAKYVILSSSCVPSEYLSDETPETISRGIFITDRSILSSEKEPLTLLQFPPMPQITENPVTVIELGPGTHACPEGLYLVHMTTKMTKDASSDLKHVTDALFKTAEESEKPIILRSLTWNVSRGNNKTNENCPDNVKICNGPDLDLDFDFSIEQAKTIFRELSDEEFLPRAPDPDEIILDEIDNNTVLTAETVESEKEELKDGNTENLEKPEAGDSPEQGDDDNNTSSDTETSHL